MTRRLLAAALTDLRVALKRLVSTGTTNPEEGTT